MENHADGHRGTNVELTVRSLHGIEWQVNSELALEAPPMTATVAFTGSASNMEVSSSTMCARTGRLIIETNAINVDTEQLRQQQPERTPMTPSPSGSTSNSADAKDITRSFRLVANFCDTEEGRRSPPLCQISSSSILGLASRPHLRLGLPPHDPNGPFVPLSKSNRDSRIILSSCDDTTAWLESEEATSTCSTGSKLTTILPEIIEVHVALRDESEVSGVFQEGIAHLVLFGNQKGNGPCILDLPIKRKMYGNPIFPTDPASTTLSTMQLEPSAFIRVQVSIFSDQALPKPLPPPRATMPKQIFESNKEIGGIMDHLRYINESRQFGFLQRTSPEAAAPAVEGSGDKVGSNKNKKITKKTFLSSRFACGGFDLIQSLQSFVEDARGCNSNNKKLSKKRAVAGVRQMWPNSQGYGFAHQHSFMASTIATRESHDM
jgi:hypothetical protein